MALVMLRKKMHTKNLKVAYLLSIVLQKSCIFVISRKTRMYYIQNLRVKNTSPAFWNDEIIFMANVRDFWLLCEP